MDASNRGYGAVVAAVGIALSGIVLSDVYADWLVQGEPLWLTVAENVVPLALATAVVYVGYRLVHRPDVYAATVTRWTVLGVAAILLIVGWVVGIQVIQGKLKPFTIAAQTAVGGAVAGVLVGRRTAQTRAARETLEAEKHRWESLFDHSPDAIVDVTHEDGSLVVRAANEAFRSVVDEGAVTGESLFEVTAPDQSTRTTIAEAVAAGENHTTETQWSVADGSTYFNTIVVPYSGRDRRRAFVILVDISEIKQTQRNLEATVERLERSNERLQEFAYVASHDLQEPLRMVSSYMDLLASEYEGELDEEADEYIEYAVDGAERMQDMIDALLQYSRVKTHAEPFAEVDADAVLAEVLQDLELLAAEHDATVDREELPTVAADHDQLGQVFRNLVKNAIEHGGDEPTVHVSATDAGEFWEFAVSDDGPGIPEDQQDRLFRLFERGGTDGDGTGIGLAVVERIVDRHGGDIWVESEPGEGATFRFTMPKEAPQQSTSLHPQV